MLTQKRCYILPPDVCNVSISLLEQNYSTSAYTSWFLEQFRISRYDTVHSQVLPMTYTSNKAPPIRTTERNVESTVVSHKSYYIFYWFSVDFQYKFQKWSMISSIHVFFVFKEWLADWNCIIFQFITGRKWGRRQKSAYVMKSNRPQLFSSPQQ